MKLKAAALAAPATEATATCALRTNNVEVDIMLADLDQKGALMDYVRFMDNARSEDSKLMIGNAKPLVETLRRNF